MMNWKTGNKARPMPHPGNAAEAVASTHARDPNEQSAGLGDRVDLLLAMRRHLEIVHHIPGRLRVRAGAGLMELASRWRGRTIPIDEAVGVIDGILAARVNPMAASAVIEYDPARVPPDAWHRLLESDEDEARRILRDHVPNPGRFLEPGNPATSKEDD
jgi:hypothetical protein